MATKVLEATKRVPLVSLVLPTTVVLLALAAFGGLFERQRWAWWAELMRLPLAVAVLAMAFAGSEYQSLIVGIALATALTSAVFLWRVRGHLTPEARAAAVIAAENLAMANDSTQPMQRDEPRESTEAASVATPELSGMLG